MEKVQGYRLKVSNSSGEPTGWIGGLGTAESQASMSLQMAKSSLERHQKEFPEGTILAIDEVESTYVLVENGIWDNHLGQLVRERTLQ